MATLWALETENLHRQKSKTLLSVLFVVKRDCRDDDFTAVYQKKHNDKN